MSDPRPDQDPRVSDEPPPVAEPTRGEPVPGRRVVLVPPPPGMWLVLLGVGVAALAPLFGFLVGGAIGAGDLDARFDPLAAYLFVGLGIGAIGVAVAVLGGARLWRYYRRQDVADEEAAVPVGTRIAEG